MAKAMERRSTNSFEINERCGRPGWTRTSDHLLRRQVLYPPELRAQIIKTSQPTLLPTAAESPIRRNMAALTWPIISSIVYRVALA
jgi:hypothetical protein